MTRPSPEQILQRIEEEERKGLHGKLKIYLGAAPGVGKTFSMLQDALAKRAQGLDVVVGIVESHGRQEIEKLLKNLELIPRQNITYHEQKLTEFDLDGALKRSPAIILVDEMAHTNVPNLRHTKRWQDIKELLDRGIDVYTTLNVQHIESLNDVVSQIIHTHVKETVPDFMIELADTIELVDLAPEDLLKRLKEGKVYIPTQAALATEHFFRKGNLSALREIALRVTAERVGEQVLLYRQGQNIQHIWPSHEKILVCLEPKSASTKIIRAARRMASNLKADWTVIYIDSPYAGTHEAVRKSAIQQLRLAEQLGAHTKIIAGVNPIKEIMNFSREQNVTRIVMAKQTQSLLKRLFYGNLTERLIRQSEEIDVYLISDDTQPKTRPPIETDSKIFPWAIYSLALGMVTFISFINVIFAEVLPYNSMVMLYFLGIISIALFAKLGPSIFASILSVLTYDYFFVPAFYSFKIIDSKYVFSEIIMLLVAFIVSYLTVVSRRQARAAYLAEQRTSTLHALSRQLAETRGVQKLLKIAVRYIAEVFDSDVMALMPNENGLEIRESSLHTILNEKEISVAQWVYDLGQVAGLGTDTLPFSDAIYLPLLASQRPLGVMRIQPHQKEQLFSPEQIHLLEACVTQIALTLEVDRLQEQAKQSEIRNVTDRARGALLESVSHDLRAPIITVMGLAKTLTELNETLTPQVIKKLGKEMFLELEQLSRLMNNLLQITYLESEFVKLQKNPWPLKDIIEKAFSTAKSKLQQRLVQLTVPKDMPLVPVDQTLIEEALTNLLDNVAKFTPSDSALDIIIGIQNQEAIVTIADRGPGIAIDEVDKLFEKYYRGRLLTIERGLGLGLAICQRIIAAHGGKIWAENREGGGAVFKFTLPLVN